MRSAADLSAPLWSTDDGGVREEALRQTRIDAQRRKRKRSGAAAGERGERVEVDARWYDAENQERMKDASWWEAICPDLRCCRGETSPLISILEAQDAKGAVEAETMAVAGKLDKIAKTVATDGVARYTPAQRIRSADGECRYTELIQKLSKGIQELHNHGMEASFIILFDELWELARIIEMDVSTLTRGRLRLCHDMLAWRVQNGKRTDAFSPHRDRQPDDIGQSFYEDGTPKFMTAWLAINSGATPDCSCLYCLPAGVDEGYRNGDDESTSPLDAIFGGRKEVFQDIRCLPCEIGSGILFSHRLLHWGSRGCALDEQRISVSFAFADAEWEAPYLKDEHRSFPPLELRLGLTCGQLISYYQRFDVYSDKLRRARELFKCAAEGGGFREAYVKKVVMESAGALKLCELDPASSQDTGDVDEITGGGDAAVGDDGDGDDDDALLDAMLDAAQAGYTDIFDEEEEEEDEIDEEGGDSK